MLRVRSSAVIHYRQAVFGSIRADAEIPVAYGTRLLVGGGGGESGYGYGEAGIKMLMIGEGRSGSWFAHTVLGYGGTFSRQIVPDALLGRRLEQREAFGPYMGLGVEWRI